MDIPSISFLHPLVNQAFRIAYQELDLAQLVSSQKLGAGVGRICYPTGRRLAKPPYSRHPPLNIEKIRQLRQQMDDLLDHLWSQSEDT